MEASCPIFVSLRPDFGCVSPVSSSQDDDATHGGFFVSDLLLTNIADTMPRSTTTCATAAQLNALLPTIYNRMHLTAQHLLLHSKWSQHMEAYDLVHETYIKLYQYPPSQRVQDQQHLLALSVRMMRQVLVDYVRKHSTQKRGGTWERVDWAYASTVLAPEVELLIDFDEALTHLQHQDARMAQIIEYRFYGNMKMDEIAVALALSDRTVARLWKRTRTYLQNTLTQDEVLA